MGDSIYLDHAATTPMDAEVLEAMMPYLKEEFGSATTMYTLGLRAGEAVEAARSSIASLIGASEREIYFTSGGTESDNWAIKGVCEKKANRGKHIITQKTEHHAVLDTYHYLEAHGYEATYLEVDEDGKVGPEKIAEAMRDDTILVSVMHANNEIGTIMDIPAIGKICRERDVHFHVDAVQTVGHIPINVEELGCDSLASSAHKLYGPKGVGILYVRKGTRMERYAHGGAQEHNRRAGTHNVPGIVGFGKAAELAASRMQDETRETSRLRDKLIAGIEKSIDDCKLNGHRTDRLPNNVNFSFFGIEGESMILLMDMSGIDVSSGSACTSGSLDPSHVLMALGLKHELAHGSLRMTLGNSNTEEHIEKVLKVLPGIVGRLREMSPLYN